MEAQIFTLDSKRFLLHRSAHAHGSDKNDPKHRYLRCDIDDNCSLHPLTDEVGATAPSVTPDGKHVYYFVDETEPGGGKLTLKRVGIDGNDRRTLMVIDSDIPGTKFRPSQIYPISSISSDGKRLALPAFLGDGKKKRAPFGLMIFDIAKLSVWIPLKGTSWCNIHPQYSRSLDTEMSHDVLVQENHGGVYDASGEITTLVGGKGADIHVIRDDGTDFRTMPWGRDGKEFCQGHQCWRGRSEIAITSTYGTAGDSPQTLVEGKAVADKKHIGLKTPGGWRNEISRNFTNPQFCHFGTDIDGKLLVSDWCREGRGELYVAELPEGDEPVAKYTYLLNTRSKQMKKAHIHPFLSPDGKAAFFNSDESGILQAYMVRGW